MPCGRTEKRPARSQLLLELGNGELMDERVEKGGEVWVRMSVGWLGTGKHYNFGVKIIVYNQQFLSSTTPR